LKSLRLQGCSIESNSSSDQYWWSNLANIEHLKVINCVNVSEIFNNFKPFTELKSLTIRDSLLDEVDISCDALTSLEHLDLSNNLITKFTPQTCSDSGPLRTLNLHGNELSELDWAGLDIFPQLESVNLSSNPQLEVMRPGGAELVSLSVLDLSHDVRLETLCDSLLMSLPNLSRLILKGVRLTSLPPALLQLPASELLDLSSLRPDCSCSLLGWLTLQPGLTCMQGSQEIQLSSESELVERLGCSPAELVDSEEERRLEVLSPGKEQLLNCEVEGSPSPAPSVLWLTPRHELISLRPGLGQHCTSQHQQVLSASSQAYSSWPGHFNILHNGSLLIDQFGWRDRGQYHCYVDNILANSSASTLITLDHQYRQTIYLWSLLYGLVTAVSFLALTLLGKLIHHLAWNYGCCYCCSCCHSEPPPKIKRLTAVVDSIEQYRIGQLEKLRENYALQSQRIRDNYTLQLERLRENYSHQSRAENTENVNRVREYSNMQLAKLHENYIFQRQRLRKFSAQNYLKIRETGKYTQKTLNRVIENMPTLTEMTNCRGGPDWDEEDEEDRDLPVEMLMMQCRGDSQSLYFTPSGTPLREVISPELGAGSSKGAKRKSHKRMVSNLSNFLPFWWGMGQTEMDPNSNTVGTTIAIVETEKPGLVSTCPEDVQLMMKTEDSETENCETEPPTETPKEPNSESGGR